MPSLKEVRNRIKSISSTQQITKAMKMVSASKLRRAQDNILQMRPYAEKLNEILNNVIRATESSVSSKYAEVRDLEKVLIIPITSDRGLCGAFNSNIVKKTRMLVQEEYMDYYKNKSLFIMPIGRKAFDFYKKQDYLIIDKYWEIFRDLSYELVREVSEFAMNSFTNGEVDRVILVYNEFKNVATQILKVDQFLPIVPPSSDIKGGLSIDYIFEPSEIEIVKDLIPKSLHIQFYKAILESLAAEHGARMTAMDQATENADELLGDLRITYNRTRQAVITKELNEIVGGANALSGE